MKKEEWRDIAGYDNYQVSSYGRIMSKNRIINQKGHKNIYARKMDGRILKQRKQNGGYLIVWLCKDGKPKAVTVHRIVACAFLGEKDLDVNHKDGNKENNNIENLEWVTRSTNITHSYRVLNHKKNNKKVMCVETGEIFNSIKEASEKKNINYVSISHALAGRNKTAGGYTWKSK